MAAFTPGEGKIGEVGRSSEPPLCDRWRKRGPRMLQDMSKPTWLRQDCSPLPLLLLFSRQGFFLQTTIASFLSSLDGTFARFFQDRRVLFSSIEDDGTERHTR